MGEERNGVMERLKMVGLMDSYSERDVELNLVFGLRNHAFFAIPVFQK